MNNLSADMVSRIEFDEKEQECLAKEEQIQVRLDRLQLHWIVLLLQILQAKIRRLEHLLHLKDIRVDDLSQKLDQTRGFSIDNGGASNRQQPTHVPNNKRK